MSARHCLVALLCASGLTRPAHAQPSASARPAKVTLIQDDCASNSYEPREFAAQLKIELRSLGVAQLAQPSDLAALDPQSAGLAIVHITCSGEAGLTVELADLATGKQLRRELQVTDVDPTARARALSMAVAVLIETSWAELLTQPGSGGTAFALPAAVQDVLRHRLVRALQAEPIAQPVPQAPRPPDARAALVLFAAARSFPARGTGLLGIDLLYLPMLGPVRLAMNAEAMLGNQELSDHLGPIATMHLYWVSTGLSVTWSSATQPELSLGPYARIGYGTATAANVRDDFSSPTHAGGVLATLGMLALLRAAVARGVDIWAGFDVGYVPGGVLFLADLSRVAGMAEVTMSARVGVGFGF